MVEVDGIEYEVYNGFSLVEVVGKELQNVILTDEDGKSYTAVLCKENKKAYITGEVDG